MRTIALTFSTLTECDMNGLTNCLYCQVSAWLIHSKYPGKPSNLNAPLSSAIGVQLLNRQFRTRCKESWIQAKAFQYSISRHAEACDLFVSWKSIAGIQVKASQEGCCCPNFTGQIDMIQANYSHPVDRTLVNDIETTHHRVTIRNSLLLKLSTSFSRFRFINTWSVSFEALP